MPRRKMQAGPARPNSRYKCRTCGTWRFATEFSDAALRFLDPNADPAACFMTCRPCEEEPEKHMCEGECGLEKPVEEFSKASRRDQKWKCMACVSWDGLHEPYVPPLEPEQLATMSFETDAATGMSGGVYMEEPAGRPEDGSWSNAISAATSSSATDYSDTASDMTFTAADHFSEPADRTARRPVHYNAFDSYGQLHEGRKIPTEASSSASQASGSTNQVSDTEWPTLADSRKSSKAKSKSSVAASSSSSAYGGWGSRR